MPQDGCDVSNCKDYQVIEAQAMDAWLQYYGRQNQEMWRITTVISNTLVPNSTLKMKEHSTNYDYVEVTSTAGIVLIFKVDTGSSLADLHTKLVIRTTRKEISQKILRSYQSNAN